MGRMNRDRRGVLVIANDGLEYGDRWEGKGRGWHRGGLL